MIDFFNFRKVPLTEAVEFLHEVTGENFILSSKIDGDLIQITLRTNHLSLKNTLNLLLDGHGLTFTWKYGAIVIEKK